MIYELNTYIKNEKLNKYSGREEVQVRIKGTTVSGIYLFISFIHYEAIVARQRQTKSENPQITEIRKALHAVLTNATHLKIPRGSSIIQVLEINSASAL